MPRTIKENFDRFQRMRETAFQLAYAYFRLADNLPRHERRAFFATLGERVHKCASCFYVGIVRPKHDDPYLRISNRGSCNWKLCPLCARRLAWQRQQLLAALLNIIFTRHPGSGLYVKFATWTLRNEKISDCADMFVRMKAAVANLLAHPVVQEAHRGAWVQFECPIRQHGTEAGWHAHALLICDASCKFIHFTGWQSLLQASAGLEYSPMIGIELARGGPEDSPHDRALAAARDAAKYVCAPLSLLHPDSPKDLFDDPATMPWIVNDDALRWLTLAVYKKRLHRCTGLWADALAEHRKRQFTASEFGADDALSPALA